MIKEHQVLSLMLFLGLLVGLIFINLLPPWQHYDEPTHFEYAWLIANQEGIPEPNEFDQGMRREVASSMIEHGFFNGLNFIPDLLMASDPIWLGSSQTGSQVIYYWLAAIPLRFLQATDVTFQLKVLRYFSLFSFLMTIAAAHGIANELTHRPHPLRWLLPLSILLLPGFVGLITAVNDDVGAIAFFSLFLLAGIRLLKRGFNWIRFFVFIVCAIISFYTKNTVMIAVLLVLIPVLFSIVKGSKRRFVWIGFASSLILLAVSLITWGDPAGWHRNVGFDNAARARKENPSSGDYVFKFSLTPEKGVGQYFQFLPEITSGNSTFTVGAWIWADKPGIVRTPILTTEEDEIFKVVEVSSHPTFYAVTGNIAASGGYPKIVLSPSKQSMDVSNNVYYDGIVLVKGNVPEDEVPKFHDQSGESGSWGSNEFTNLIRNPSAERGRLKLRSWIEKAIIRRFLVNPSSFFGLIIDPVSLDSYYKATIKSLMQTFWAKFGWGHVVLNGFRPYTILALFTLSGIVGAIISFWRHRNQIQWDIFFFFGASLIVVWGAAFMRGLPSISQGNIYIPVARYAYPVIIPTMLILNIGWLEIIGWIERYTRIKEKVLLGLLISFFVFLNILSVISIYQFYYS